MKAAEHGLNYLEPLGLICSSQDYVTRKKKTTGSENENGQSVELTHRHANFRRTRLLGFTILGFTIFKSTGKLSWFSNVILSQGVSFI